MSTSFPVVIAASGAQPTAPADILSTLITQVSATNPGYTANLPGSLIEDVSSTEVGGIVLCDQARVEAINSLTPFGANAFLLNQLGQVYGVQQGIGSNTSVYVVFTGTPGYVIAQGFIVSDGTNQYTVQDGGIIGSGGTSAALYCLAVNSGAWAVPIGSVTFLITSVPTGITLSVINPSAGTPSTSAQTEQDYRTQVLQAGVATSQGMPAALKTLLGNVSGVQSRLVSVRQQSPGWEVIVGGGDPYAVANAIYTALFDISSLVGSTLSVTAITNANPGVVTTALNHGLTTGSVIYINGIVGMTALNSIPLTVTSLSLTTFSIGVNTTSYTTYVSGGVITPNPRNITVGISDYPDTYSIPFVNPPQQSVTVAVTWNTSVTNFTQQVAVSQLGGPALVSYINSIPVGAPINVFELQTVFQAAIASVLPPALLTRMIFAVSVNGIGVSPTAGTEIIPGDPESYFEAAAGSVTFAQG